MPEVICTAVLFSACVYVRICVYVCVMCTYVSVCMCVLCMCVIVRVVCIVCVFIVCVHVISINELHYTIYFIYSCKLNIKLSLILSSPNTVKPNSEIFMD